MKKLLLIPLLCAVLPAAQKFDAVVYGGRAGGVIAAVSAAREGLTVALLEPGIHLGGMVSSRRPRGVGGFFFARARAGPGD